MVFTITSAYIKRDIMVYTEDERFLEYPTAGRRTAKTYGLVLRSHENIYKGLQNIASWVANELNEECSFEVDKVLPSVVM